MIVAIQKAEKNTSGEIRIHIENHFTGNILDRAAKVFAQLKMHKTALRNGVLIYVALQGINAKAPDHFWDNIKNQMIEQFKAGKVCEGLCQAVLAVGQQLKTYFPCTENDINELPDDISFKD